MHHQQDLAAPMAMLYDRSRMAVLVVICLLSLARGLKVMQFPTKACSTRSSRSSTSNSKSALKIQAPAKAAAVSPTQGLASAEDNFNWEKAWYPVLSEVDSDPQRAHAIQVCDGSRVYFWAYFLPAGKATSFVFFPRNLLFLTTIKSRMSFS